MTRKVLTALALALALGSASAANPEACYSNAVPLPAEIVLAKGAPFTLSAATPVCYTAGDTKMERNARFLIEYVEQNTGIRMMLSSAKSAKGAIRLELNKKIDNPEGYEVKVSVAGVVITGSTPAGVFYGVQLLRKAIPVKAGWKSVSLPAATIKDAPRFGYRGMHLDCGRHFFTLDFVKEYIDLIALHNMNRFHWHLTEDQGWRIEIKKYPRLTEIGSVRSGTGIGHATNDMPVWLDDKTPHGGFYTQEECREIVRYAAERNIEVIPEIDMPGHMLGALAAYPELGCTGGPYEVEHRWGVFPDVLCCGNEKVYAFIKDVLDEVMDIFPSQYIHIGGDESPRDRWKVCPKCQAKIKAEGIPSGGKHSAEDLLQSYFTNRVNKYLESKGRRMIGWDEIFEGDILQSSVIMSWRGAEPGARAAVKGHDVIMTPGSHVYFDHYQVPKEQQGREPESIGGCHTVEQVYGFEPVPASADAQTAAHIIGAQANLWTEYIAYPSFAEYQVLPRMAALAEVQWMQPDKKNYQEFLKRVTTLRDIYDKNGYTYAHHIWQPAAK